MWGAEDLGGFAVGVRGGGGEAGCVGDGARHGEEEVLVYLEGQVATCGSVSFVEYEWSMASEVEMAKNFDDLHDDPIKKFTRVSSESQPRQKS